jgi:hypothetical protein
MPDPKADAAPGSSSTDPAVVTDQALKGAGRAEKAGSADGAGINAGIIDAIPGREPKPGLAPGDPGINASVVS